METHALISGVHNVTGLPWAASIPLVAFLVRVFVLFPTSLYCHRILVRWWRLYPRFIETRTAIEKKVRQEHGNKSPGVRQMLLNGELSIACDDLIKQNGAQHWKSYILWIKVPVWLTMVETLRRMTGTEEGILALIGKSLARLEGKQNTELSKTDQVIPIEPSLASEGMLWFDNLMIPDPTNILTCALSGITYIMYSNTTGISRKPPPWASVERAHQVESSNLRLIKYKKIGALLIGPATLMFPSAILLYWFSSVLATVVVAEHDRLWRMLLQIMGKSPEKSEPDEDKPKSKPQKTEKYYPSTRRDAREQKRNKK